MSVVVVFNGDTIDDQSTLPTPRKRFQLLSPHSTNKISRQSLGCIGTLLIKAYLLRLSPFWLDKHKTICNIWQNLPFMSNRWLFCRCRARTCVRVCEVCMRFIQCSLQVSLNLWWCFATPGAKEDLKNFPSNKKKRGGGGEREREREREREEKIVVDHKQIGKIYGLWETTLLNICHWQIRHSCVPYPVAAENSRMII